MGMYDYINGEKVYLFTQPLEIELDIKNEEIKNTRVSRGGLVNYSVDEKIPYKTFFYDYGENFIIWDFEESILHIIKEGRVEGTYSKEEFIRLNISFEDFKVVTTYGYFINIKCNSDLSFFQREYIAYKKKIIENKRISYQSLLRISEAKKSENKELQTVIDVCNKKEYESTIACEFLKKQIVKKWGLLSQLTEENYIFGFIITILYYERFDINKEGLIEFAKLLYRKKPSILDNLKKSKELYQYAKELLSFV